MLKKLRNILLIGIIITIFGIIIFYVFIKPSGFTDKEELINSYFDNIQSNNLCSEHFNKETIDFCTGFQLIIEDKSIEVIDLTKDGDNYLVRLSIDGTIIDFDITIIEVVVTGVKSIMNKTYYLIDLII